MKGLKRRLAAVLAVCMVLTGVLPAFADTAGSEDLRTVSEVTEYRKATPSDAEDTAVEGTAKDIEKEPEKIASEKATPSDAKKNAEVLIRETIVDGIRITLTADPGVFPEDAELWAENVEDPETLEAIDKAVQNGKSREEAERNIASSLKFDIRMLLDGEEIQPDTTKGTAKISFALEEKLNDCLEVNMYHVKDEDDGLAAETLDTKVETGEAVNEEDDGALIDDDSEVILSEEGSEGTVITAETDGFSYYVVEFTYNELQYVLNGDSSIKLSEILKTFGIEGTVSEAEVSNEELFTAEKDPEGDDWTVTALQAFSSEEWLKVTIGVQEYIITITDAQDPVSYFDWDDENKELIEQFCTEYTVIDSGTAEPDGGYVFESGKWYVVKGTVTFYKRIENKAAKDTPAHLILVDEKTLTATGGIHNPDGKGLLIYGQSAGSGKLTIEHVSENHAAIGGGDGETGGSITINGGTVTPTGGINGAGIGGGHYGSGGSITINGGTVIAVGGDYGAGIGGGEYEPCGTVVINGGTVSAHGGQWGGAGIGAGFAGGGGSVTINDGLVTAVGVLESAGIGGGMDGNGANVAIYGGTITATGNKAPAIGYGYISPTGPMVLPGELRFGRNPVLIKGTDDTGEHTLDIKSLEDDCQRCKYTSLHMEYQKAEYTVEHWFQQELFTEIYQRDDAETEILTGYIGNDTEAKPKQFSGYRHNSTAQVKIEAGKSAVAVVKYDLYYTTIRFNMNGHGTAISSITKVPGADIRGDEPEKPTAEGYLFEGWFTDTDFKNQFTFTAMPSADLTLYAKWAADPTKWKEVPYVDENGSTQTALCIVISSDYSFCTFEKGGWYAVTGNAAIANRIENNASTDAPAHLILTDGFTLTVNGGIHNASGKGLCIYGQEKNTGGLVISGASSERAGIGGNREESGGTITISGGKVNAGGGRRAAGIGSGYDSGAGGSVIINGGQIEASGGTTGPGIGGRTDVVINGGKVIATGGIRSTGKIIISGGEITAVGVPRLSSGGAGIGSQNGSACGSITITGGKITATGSNGGAGIGGGNGSTGVTITVTGGEITATGSSGGAGIGGGNSGAGGKVTITGGKITAIGTDGGAGVGRGSNFTTPETVDISEELEILAGISKESRRYQSSELYYRTRDPYVTIQTAPSYGVQHLQQKADGTGYEESETETLPGHTGEKTRAAFKSYEGFMPLTFEQQTVKDDGSTVVEIHYDRLMYTLVFDANGHGKAPAAITGRYGAAVSKPEDPIAEGYIFGGWYEEESCTTPFTFATMLIGGKTVYAKWTKAAEKKYTIRWMLNDIALIDTTEVSEGEMPVHANPAIEGYIFIGWQPALAPVTGNVKYTAYFEERGTDKIAVTFNTGGGTFINTQVIDRNTTPVKPEDPQKAGCRFEGWYREAGFITPYKFNEPFNTDMTLYAKWEVLPAVVYTVTWNMDDGTLIDTTRVNQGEMPVHGNPSKDGYIFVGWNPAPAPVTRDITYTAWFEKRSPDKAAVTFNTDGGSFVETQVITKGQKAVRPSDPAKTGYEFVNWYADAAFAALYDFSTAVTADITVYAKWKKTAGREYTVTWKDWNGKTLAEVKVEEGGLPDYPGASSPKRSGYIFTGWTPKIGLAYADTTYTATYAPQTVINGGGGGGSSAPAAKKAAVTFSPNWYTDIYGVWRIKNSAGQVVTNAWLCDDAVDANGQNVWYLLTHDGAMLAAGLVQDATGNFYSLETNHDGYFGMLRYTDGYYNCNGQQVYLKFSHEHDGTFGAVINAEGIEKLKAIYGVTQYGIGNENSVYTATF